MVRPRSIHFHAAGTRGFALEVRRLATSLGPLLLLLALSGGPAARAAELEENLASATLNVGFIQSCFLGVNRTDAASAFKVLADTVGRKRGYRLSTQTLVFESFEEIEAAVKAGSVNLAIIDSWRCVGKDLGDSMTPYFVTSEQGKLGKTYLLLTRRSSGVNSVGDLRGKDLLELDVANSTAGKAWLDTVLLEHHGSTPPASLRAVELVGKPSLAVLPVFFGKRSACLVDQFSFDLIRELNPQVGRELQTIAKSDPYVDNVLYLSHKGWASEKAKADVAVVLAELHLEPAGQQILTLFKVGPMVPFQESQLDTVRKLREKHDRLLKGAAP
jgi:phosphonate transport system substrate-binding protein